MQVTAALWSEIGCGLRQSLQKLLKALNRCVGNSNLLCNCLSLQEAKCREKKQIRCDKTNLITTRRSDSATYSCCVVSLHFLWHFSPAWSLCLLLQLVKLSLQFRVLFLQLANFRGNVDQSLDHQIHFEVFVHQLNSTSLGGRLIHQRLGGTSLGEEGNNVLHEHKEIQLLRVEQRWLRIESGRKHKKQHSANGGKKAEGRTLSSFVTFNISSLCMLINNWGRSFVKLNLERRDLTEWMISNTNLTPFSASSLCHEATYQRWNKQIN